MLRVALLALALVSVAACAGDDASDPAEPPADTGAAPEPQQAPQIITEADSGASFVLPVGGEASLRLSSDWAWEEPVVDGDAVSLTVVNYVQDPGFSEWIVMAEAPGPATIAATGEPACAGEDGCADEPRDFQVTITVE